VILSSLTLLRTVAPLIVPRGHQQRAATIADNGAFPLSCLSGILETEALSAEMANQNC
jgi:hypothetical protein